LIPAEKAVSDGAQSVDVAPFQKMMDEIKPYIALWHDSRKREVAPAAR
jgi:3-deoxy-D-arabino-heptulosonate 7-phosphate (DAHP) synthase